MEDTIIKFAEIISFELYLIRFLSFIKFKKNCIHVLFYLKLIIFLAPGLCPSFENNNFIICNYSLSL